MTKPATISALAPIMQMAFVPSDFEAAITSASPTSGSTRTAPRARW